MKRLDVKQLINECTKIWIQSIPERLGGYAELNFRLIARKKRQGDFVHHTSHKNETVMLEFDHISIHFSPY